MKRSQYEAAALKWSSRGGAKSLTAQRAITATRVSTAPETTAAEVRLHLVADPSQLFLRRQDVTVGQSYNGGTGRKKGQQQETVDQRGELQELRFSCVLASAVNYDSLEREREG